jgi:small subunit ribosomal protein S19
MSRSVWKGHFLDYHLFKKLKKASLQQKGAKKRNQQKKLTLWSRRSVILPQTIGFKVNLYNGKKFVPIIITEEMVGHKLGEFVPTRARLTHKVKTK